MNNYNRNITFTLITFIIILVILGVIAVTGQKNAFGEATIVFNLDHEISLPNWFSTILLFSLSCLTFFIAFTETVLKKEYASHWRWLGIIFLLMSIEEVASLRDSLLTIPLRNLFNLTGIFYYSWVIPIGILVMIFIFLYTKFMLNLPPKTRNFFILGIIVYVTGAIGFELFGGWIIADRSFVDSYEFITIIEETFELLGVTFILHSLFLYISHDSWDMLKLEKIKDSDINIRRWQISIFAGLTLMILVVSVTGFLSYRNRDYVSLTTLHMWDNLPMEAPPNQEALIFGDNILPFWGAHYDYQAEWNLIDVNLWWWTQSAPENNYSIGVYLLNSEGMTIAQTDGAINDLYYGTIETSQMEANRIYVDQRIITLPEDLPADNYSLYLAVYQWWDGVKLELETGEDLLYIGEVVIP